MEINLTPAQSEFMRNALDTSRIRDLEEAVQQAVAQWIERERSRAEFLKSLEDANASFARGEGRTITNEAERVQLIADVMKRCADRLAADKSIRN